MNKEAFADFFYWVNERHGIYLERQKGLPKPWTNDPIFQKWRFCNVFRQLDTQSKWLIDNVIKPHWDDDPSLMLFNIYAFRAFNWYPTYERMGGWQTKWDTNKIQDILSDNQEEKLTSGAYMIRGMEGKPKSESIPEVLTRIWQERNELWNEISRGPMSLERIHNLLLNQKFWGWGPFTTYQVVLDLTYTKILKESTDINTWCEFGPGAIKGIREIWPDAARQDFLPLATKLLKDSPEHLMGHVPAMNLQDIEFCLCELSKYRRIKRGGRGKNTYDG